MNFTRLLFPEALMCPALARSAFLAASLLILCSNPATAQPAGADVQARVSGLVGAAFGGDSLVPTFSGAIGFQFNRRIGLELDFGYLDSLETVDDDLPRILSILQISGPLTTFLPGGTAIFPPIPSITLRTDSRIVTLIGNIVIDLPTAGRLRPYVVAGGGIANLSRRMTFESPLAAQLTFPFLIFPRNDNRTNENALAVTTGGGIDIMMRHGFAVGVDVRYLFVPSDIEDLNLARVGIRASYRF